jgi:hypothetical protein
LQKPDSPPLPFNLFPELPLYWLGDDVFAMDDREVDYQSIALSEPESGDSPLGAAGVCGDLTFPVVTFGDEFVVTMSLTNLDPGIAADVFAKDWLDGEITPWRWIARGTNGQVITFTNGTWSQGYYMVGCTNDSDADGLTDAYELLVSKTSPTNAHSVNALFTDSEMNNVLVNDLREDYGTDQNTQDETTLVVWSKNVMVAWVDSNSGVPGYGNVDPLCNPSTPWVPSAIPQFIGWAVSRDGGSTFDDEGSLPLLSNVVAFVLTNYSTSAGYYVTTNLGNAGDPVLARDISSGNIYLTGNPQRPSVYWPNGAGKPGALWVPFWRSTNDGESFLPPINAVPDLQPTNVVRDVADKPALIVDNYPGPGNGDIYLAIQWVGGSGGLILSRSENGGQSWQVLHTSMGGHDARRPTFAIRTNAFNAKHEIVLGWLTGTNQFLSSKSADRGTNFSSPSPVTVFSNTTLSFSLFRSRSSVASDFFRGPIMPTIVANPVNHDLYSVYQDAPTNGATPNIYFVQSSDGGTNWSQRIQVNVETNFPATDDWQPSIAVKPDGSAIFIAWYDRRSDPTNNSLIETWGVFANAPVTNANSFASNFKISSVQFPPVFSGTLTNSGEYDPAYPPTFSSGDPRYCGSFDGGYSHHMGDYDMVATDAQVVYYTWSDNRILTGISGGIRNQADIRMIRIPWPQ